MDYFLIADTHFGHTNIKKYENRPDEFEQLILDNLSIIQEDDVLIHLGDFCFGNDVYWHEQFMSHCKGKKWLILGNHDKKSKSYYMNHGWDCVCDSIQLKTYGYNFHFSHVGEVIDLMYINIHGHTHSNNRNWNGMGVYYSNLLSKRSIAICMEHEYRPINLKEIVNHIKN